LWDATPDLRLHASISSRARFPNLFERFSSRFGTAIPNPDIAQERATSYEIGGAINLGPRVTVEGAVFYTDLTDALVQVPVALGAPFGTVNQTRNAGKGQYAGIELALTASVSEGFDLGGNLTLMDREFDQVGNAPSTTPDPTNPTFQPQGVPNLKAFLYASVSPFSGFSVTPSLEIASDRWTVTSSSAITPPRFYETGAYTLVNLAASWDMTPNLSVLVSARNLSDSNYVLVDGFPEEGRSFTLSLKLRN
jgi:iron complex outermembrane receptor protein